MALDRYIHDLLFEHDCVIVPGFGGFLTHYRPARLDVQRRLVLPPSKDISFNRKLVRQDGLLADQLVRHEGLDFTAAGHRLEQELQQWQRRLREQGRLEVARVGTFFHDAEHNLQFEPDRRVNFLKEAFGLVPVEAVPVLKSVMPSPVAETVAGPAVHAGNGRAGWLAAAAAVAIAFTAATWYLVGTLGKEAPRLANIGPGQAGEAARYQLPKAPPVAMAALDVPEWTAPADLYGIHDLPIAGPDVRLVAVNFGQAPGKAVAESTAVAKAATPAAVPAAGPRFHIIGGCFLEKENADRFVAELQAKGFAASLIDRMGGLYRVAYGSYPQRAMALDALGAVRKEIAPEAWLLVK
ncbi:MAG: SPOR domain-containing protein [Bacteroidetes bacterium]|nr:SPOR domain-containing protein [Bacteroidota bacterium]